MSMRSIAAFLFVVVVLACVGCGPGKGEVRGTAMYQKRPLAGATITVFDSANNARSDTVKEDGAYHITDVATGPARISISMPMPISVPGKAAPKSSPLPTKYADAEKSGLTYDVKSGSNSYPIDIE
ncbi:MAG: carboxypeptidase regulatory-like domain-containing protein [Planctomycetes bacterium]|nr:carboxypeptidase regulatory-like domain-containing protein [Planctomycetota bacterium]